MSNRLITTLSEPKAPFFYKKKTISPAVQEADEIIEEMDESLVEKNRAHQKQHGAETSSLTDLTSPEKLAKLDKRASGKASKKHPSSEPPQPRRKRKIEDVDSDGDIYIAPKDFKISPLNRGEIRPLVGRYFSLKNTNIFVEIGNFIIPDSDDSEYNPGESGTGSESEECEEGDEKTKKKSAKRRTKRRSPIASKFDKYCNMGH